MCNNMNIWIILALLVLWMGNMGDCNNITDTIQDWFGGNWIIPIIILAYFVFNNGWAC